MSKATCDLTTPADTPHEAFRARVAEMDAEDWSSPYWDAVLAAYGPDVSHGARD